LRNTAQNDIKTPKLTAKFQIDAISAYFSVFNLDYARDKSGPDARRAG
jgi:hypothetical protein